MKETLLSQAKKLAISLDEAQIAQFCVFSEALLEKNKVMNLTAITEPREVARLHFADCLALLGFEHFHNKSVIDVGCGAGFPGVPLKLGEPSIQLTLLDSLRKRVDWLKETLKQMGIEADCVAARAEEYGHREEFDIATSRAVARLNILTELCLPFVKVGGCFLAMKAAAAEEELSEAKSAISRLGGKLEDVKSYDLDGASRCVLIIRKVRSTPAQYPRRFAKIKQQPL